MTEKAKDTQVIIRLASEDAKALKIKAAQEGTSRQAILEQAAKDYIQGDEKMGRDSVTITVNGFIFSSWTRGNENQDDFKAQAQQAGYELAWIYEGALGIRAATFMLHWDGKENLAVPAALVSDLPGIVPSESPLISELSEVTKQIAVYSRDFNNYLVSRNWPERKDEAETFFAEYEKRMPQLRDKRNELVKSILDGLITQGHDVVSGCLNLSGTAPASKTAITDYVRNRAAEKK